jgi:hypothetical protein
MGSGGDEVHGHLRIALAEAKREIKRTIGRQAVDPGVDGSRAACIKIQAHIIYKCQPALHPIFPTQPSDCSSQAKPDLIAHPSTAVTRAD